MTFWISWWSVKVYSKCRCEALFDTEIQYKRWQIHIHSIGHFYRNTLSWNYSDTGEGSAINTTLKFLFCCVSSRLFISCPYPRDKTLGSHNTMRRTSSSLRYYGFWFGWWFMIHRLFSGLTLKYFTFKYSKNWSSKSFSWF